MDYLGWYKSQPPFGCTCIVSKCSTLKNDFLCFIVVCYKNLLEKCFFIIGFARFFHIEEIKYAGLLYKNPSFSSPFPTSFWDFILLTYRLASAARNMVYKNCQLRYEHDLFGSVSYWYKPAVNCVSFFLLLNWVTISWHT